MSIRKNFNPKSDMAVSVEERELAEFLWTGYEGTRPPHVVENTYRLFSSKTPISTEQEDDMETPILK